MVDAELREIDELEPVALGQLPGVRDLDGLLGGVRLDAARVELRFGGRVGRSGAVGVDDFPFIGRFAASQPFDSTECPRRLASPASADYDSADDRLKSGMYSESSSPAITIPMTTSSAGSTIVTNRPRFVSISSS